MLRYSLILIFLGSALPSFPQLGMSRHPALGIFVEKDSLTGEKIDVKGGISPETRGRLLVEADANDVRKDIYEKQLLIEVIHVRNTSALARIFLTGLAEFRTTDILKALRPALEAGDRIVLTFKMMADPEPFVFIISVR